MSGKNKLRGSGLVQGSQLQSGDSRHEISQYLQNEGTQYAPEGCLPTALGARIRIDNGNITVTDGPFSEVKEVVGGFAIFSVNSKAEAIEYVREYLSVVGGGECELRQVYEAGAAPCMNQDKAASA